MEINFFEPDSVPQPKDKVKIESVVATPYPDGWRVRFVIEVTPFQERPNLEIHIRRADGHDVAHLSVIETMHRHMEFTIHIRGVESPPGTYTAGVDLYYDGEQATVQDRREVTFTVEGK
ncbi:MAG TPA: hypothetical protein VMT34_09555 [Aggregatilineales bacterium]|nr:hypothetical protein [Aggregatilineales bacterium]